MARVAMPLFLVVPRLAGLSLGLCVDCGYTPIKEIAMKKTFAFYLFQSGFQVFRKRLEQELLVERGVTLNDYADDDELYRMYQHGEPTSFVVARLCGPREE
jgi:hypothetical protein